MEDQVNETAELVDAPVEVEANEVADAVDVAVEEDQVEAVIDEDVEVTAEQALDILSGSEEEVEATEEEVGQVKAEGEEKKEEDSDEAFMGTISNERTRERFKDLSHKNKKLNTVARTQEKTIESFRSQVESTGLSNQDFVRVIGLMGKANSSDPQSLIEARDFVQNLSKTLSEKIGDTPDAYERFDDLKKDYEIGEASEAYVNREAQRRIQKETHQQAQNVQHQQKQQVEQQVMSQANNIEAMVRQFEAQDPDFQFKKPQLERMTAQIVSEGIPMERWATEFVSRYHAINVEQQKPATAPMGVGRQAKAVNNYASANVSDEQANMDFAMSLLGR
jgi:hypothetical protein